MKKQEVDGGVLPAILAGWAIIAAIDVGLITVYAMHDSSGRLKR